MKLEIDETKINDLTLYQAKRLLLLIMKKLKLDINDTDIENSTKQYFKDKK